MGATRRGGPMIRLAALACALAMAPVSARAGSDTGADFLKIPVGARALGLGQAFTALADGLSALEWNPAGLARSSAFDNDAQAGFAFSHQTLFLDSSLDHLAVSLPTRRGAATWGFSVLRLSQPDQQGRAADRTPTGSFGVSDLAVGAAFATTIRTAAVGAQLKFIRQDLAEFQSQGMALDLGVLSPTPVAGLSLGLSVRNLGPPMQFVREKFELPLTVSAGAAYRLIDPLVIGVDLYSRPHQREIGLAIGTEMQAMGNIALRAGYLAKMAEAVSNAQESETTRGSIGGLNGITAGVGLRLNAFTMDYALSQFGELGLSHAFTISTWFGGNGSPASLMADVTPIRASRALPAPQLRRPAVQALIVIIDLPSAAPDWWHAPRD